MSGGPQKGAAWNNRSLEERKSVAVPTPGQFLAEYLIQRDTGQCNCVCDLAAAQLMAAGVAPEFPAFYVPEAYEIGC